MVPYHTWSPTRYDSRGLALPDRQDWLVVGISRTRDSDALDESNFRTALAMLGGESDTVEVHRFGHWGPGWFEVILVAPGSEAQRLAEHIEDSLQEYPILDEHDYSNRSVEDD